MSDPKPRVVAIVQARMGSTRLPGKVMLPLAGRPMIHHVVERVGRVPEIDEVIVATSALERERPLVEYLEGIGIPVFRGSEQDVLERYYFAARNYNADIVVRITADCPLLSPAITSRTIRVFLSEYPKYDYASNARIRSFPRGTDTEVLSFSVLKKAYIEATKPYEREHVTPYIWMKPEQFAIKDIVSPVDLQSLRLTVDEKEDYLLARAVYDSLYPDDPNFDIGEILQLLLLNPNLIKINQNIDQKEIGQ